MSNFWFNAKGFEHRDCAVQLVETVTKISTESSLSFSVDCCRYEKELMHPISNLLNGELARGLLIQVLKDIYRI